MEYNSVLLWILNDNYKLVIDGHVNILMTFYSNGSLAERITAQRKAGVPFDFYQMVCWFEEVCGAIQFCHKRKVCHRDIKVSYFNQTKHLKILFIFGPFIHFYHENYCLLIDIFFIISAGKYSTGCR